MKALDQFLPFLRRRQVQAYLVGGTVRDMLLGRERFDLDISVASDASGLAREFADEMNAAYYVMDREHDVARVILEFDNVESHIDLARLRGEDIEQDLATRDFGINAMAMDISGGIADDGQLIDPFQGRIDLDARQLRALSSSVFENDPVRLLRAVRFEAELGLAIDDATEALVKRDAKRLQSSPPERIRDELYRIVSAENTVRNLRRLDELGLLEVIFPELTSVKNVTQSAPHVYDVFEHSLRAVGVLEEIQRGGYLELAEGAFASQLGKGMSSAFSTGHTHGVLLRIALLLHDIGKPIVKSQEPTGRIRFFGHEQQGADIAEKALRRLRFSNEEIELIATVIANHLRPILLAAGPGLSDRAVYRFYRATGRAGVDVAIHAWCDQRATFGDERPFAKEAELQSVIARLLDRYYHKRQEVVSPSPLLDGKQVMNLLGISQGPIVGQVLEALVEAQAAGEVGSQDQAVEFVRSWSENECDKD